MHASLTCLVACRLTMTTLPPLRLVRRGRFPLGLICREVPRVRARSAFLGTHRQHLHYTVFTGSKGMSGPCPVYASHAHLHVYLQGPCPLRLCTHHVTGWTFLSFTAVIVSESQLRVCALLGKYKGCGLTFLVKSQTDVCVTCWRHLPCWDLCRVERPPSPVWCWSASLWHTHTHTQLLCLEICWSTWNCR